MNEFVDKILNSASKRQDDDFYEILGCDRTSSVEQIRAEYMAKVRDLHPDKLSEEEQELQKNAFLRLQRAKEVLCDVETRRCYDAWLESALPLGFEGFLKEKNAVLTSMHWAVPNPTPAIAAEQPTPKESGPKRDDWTRHDSPTIRRFRNYDI